MKSSLFNAYNSVEVMAKELLSVAAAQRMRYRWSHDSNGERVVLCEAPRFGQPANPLRRAHNVLVGIKKRKKIYSPYVMKDHKEIAHAADSLLHGRTLLLSNATIDGIKDGAAFDLLDIGRDLLEQAVKENNLLDLPKGIDRELQFIIDGTGWTSRSGCMRMVVRCPQIREGANNIQNARDATFILGTDKHKHVEQAMRIGGERCHHARMYEGLQVTEKKTSSLPEHVQMDELFAPLAAIK